MAVNHPLYNVEPLNFLGHALCFFSEVMGYDCLHPGSTAKSVIFVYAARGETLISNVHFDACIRGFAHHIFGEENMTYR